MTSNIEILGELADKKTYNNEDIEVMDWQTKCRLIRNDPITVVRYLITDFSRSYIKL